MNSLFKFTAAGLFRSSYIQWQPTLTAHNPSPPITLESPAAGGGAVVSIQGLHPIFQGYKDIFAAGMDGALQT